MCFVQTQSASASLEAEVVAVIKFHEIDENVGGAVRRFGYREDAVLLPDVDRFCDDATNFNRFRFGLGIVLVHVSEDEWNSKL